MNELAEKIFDWLPKDGSKVSGGQVREALELSVSDYKSAKVELSVSGVVELGRGRGGTIARIEGVEKPPPPKKVTQAEKMAFARESRVAKSRQRKLRDKIYDAALEAAQIAFPDADKIEVQVWNYNGQCYVFPWKDGSAQAHEIWIDV